MLLFEMESTCDEDTVKTVEMTGKGFLILYKGVN